MMNPSRRRPTCRVYIGGLASNTRVSDIEKLFKRYARRIDILLKRGFAFVVSKDCAIYDAVMIETFTWIFPSIKLFPSPTLKLSKYPLFYWCCPFSTTGIWRLSGCRWCHSRFKWKGAPRNKNYGWTCKRSASWRTQGWRSPESYVGG